MLKLENTHYALTIEPVNGRIVSLVDKAGGYDLIAEPRLAGNFRVLLPLPEVECHLIDGAKQSLSSHEQTDDSLTLTWTTVGGFDLDVTLRIVLADDAVRFNCEVRNGTPHKLAEVWYPVLGGLQGIGGEDARDTEVLAPVTNSAWSQPLFRDFGNSHGETLGVTGAEHSFHYPGFLCMPWLSLYHPARGRALYFAALEETPRVKVLSLNMDPGTAEGRLGGNWPRPEEVGDAPLGVTMSWTHVPHTPPGETFTGATIELAGHQGGWIDAAKRYRRWFDAHFPVTPPAGGWIRRETAFTDLMFLLPEDNINLRFAEIPRWAEGAKARNIGHVMISGWHRGGHDRGYPYYEIDPRLGTWEELEAGVRACHDLGLKVSFFVNCQPIDMSTDWYREELYKYRMLDPYGQPFFIVNYWGMGTLSARTRYLGARPFCEMDPAHPEVRALLLRQFKKLVEIGADGLHIDKFFNTPMDFNPRLTWTSPDRAHHEGVLLFIEEMMAMGRAINPEFCFSYEGGWDRLMSFTDASWWGTNEDSLKAAFPQRTQTVPIAQPYDYHRVNTGVLGGSCLLVGPGNYTQTLDYSPAQTLLDYVAEITRIRQQLFDVVSLAERIDASEGIFKRRDPLLRVTGAFADSPHARWSAFRGLKDGRRAIILGNLGTEPLQADSVAFADNPAGRLRVYQAFTAEAEVAASEAITVPGERVVFIVEVNS